mgnify:CR=1 FL=1
MRPWLGPIAGHILALFGRRKHPITGEDHARADFPTSTRKMGMRFTNKIRDVFRFRWIRPAGPAPDDGPGDRPNDQTLT